MNNYKDDTGKPYALNDLQVRQGIPEKRGLTAITDEEAAEILSATNCQSCAEILAAKKAEIRATCESKIDAGFVCSALFPDANYRNSEKQNLTMGKACKNGGRIWVNEAFKFHTAEQAEEVYDFANSEIERLRLINANKQTYLEDSSRTEDEIVAVTWDSVE